MITLTVLSFQLLALASVLLASETTLGIHGSGTNNPAECFLHIIGQLESQTRIPTRITYREVGSGTGMQEFQDRNHVVDFASGDLPLTRDVYDNITISQGNEVVQLPVVLGAVTFFHNIPNTPDLNLTACLLAKIYKGAITEWEDQEILTENPNLVVPPGGLTIKAKHRSDGSSSTAAVTSYLAKSCPEEWSEEDQGTTIEWKGGSEPCQGSYVMTSKIQESEGTIGYMAAGHGHDALLQEPILMNQAGTRLFSHESYLTGGVGDAANADSLPSSPSDYFPVDKFINEPGEFVWPMVLMSYVYVRKNLTYIEDPREQALLKAFLQSLYMDEYISQCEESFEFSRASGPALELAQMGIDSLILSPEAPEFVFESSTQQVKGAGEFIISSKRNSIENVERNILGLELDLLKEEVHWLREELARSKLDQEANTFKIAKLEAAAAEPVEHSGGTHTIQFPRATLSFVFMTLTLKLVLMLAL